MSNHKSLQPFTNTIHCPEHGLQVITAGWYGCNMCREEHAKSARMSQSKYSKFSLDLPKMYKGKTFTDWRATSNGQTAKLKAVAEYIQLLTEFKSAPNLILYGCTGTGKTLLAAIVINEVNKLYLDRSSNVRMHFISSSEYLAEIKSTWNKDSRKTEFEVLLLYGDDELLVLDDVGVDDKHSGDQDRLTRLLDHRYSRGYPTIITTNLAGRDALKKHLGDRAFDRINQNAQWLELTWPSYRLLTSKSVDI